MGRINLIDDLISESVGEYGDFYVVKSKTDGGDLRRGVSKIVKNTVHLLSQPVSEKERNRMAEGDRVKTSRFYSMTGKNKVKEGDVVVDKMGEFEIKRTQNWDT